MRIYGNRQIKTLPGQLTRPTSARVREALFNIWQGKILDCRWLDLCAGSGSMGAEALCRGAKEVVGIEKSRQACRIIQQNWQQVARDQQRFQILRGDILKRLESWDEQPFDRIYFDPPYTSDLYTPVLTAIAQQQLLTPNGEIAVEHHPKYWHAIPLTGLIAYREKHYSNTTLTFYRHQLTD